MSGRAVSWALRLYPKRWRRRYGREVLDLADELVAFGETTSTRAAVGLVPAAPREHLQVLRPRRAVLAFGAAVVVLIGVLAATALGGRTPSSSRPASGAIFTAFVEPTASTREIAVLRRELSRWEPEQVRSCQYVDKAQSFAQFKEKFRADPDVVRAMTAEMMPSSFRCALAEADGMVHVVRELVAKPDIFAVMVGDPAEAKVP
ncbi:MAG TPA: permease-like cell division protein FtsX [Acidimicrobiales bacterium]|nr:permease-like cell division protein FtsX [Acidimicrobiales bacterium]